MRASRKSEPRHERGEPDIASPPKIADRLTAFFFLATIFSVSFQNVYWDVAGRVNLADVTAVLFLVAFLAGRVTDRDRLVPRTTLAVLGFAVALLLVYLAGFFNVETNQALSLYGKGMTKFADPLRVPRRGRRLSGAALRALLLADGRLVRRRVRGECGLRAASSSSRGSAAAISTRSS